MDFIRKLSTKSTTNPSVLEPTITSFFELSDTQMDGSDAPMAQYRGKVCLVVNVASK